MRCLKVLVACEFSAVVRDAFRALDHDAWSCDLLPTEGNPDFHIQGDCLKVIESRDWDLLIAHPPCTYLCNSGVRWLSSGGKMNVERYALMVKAADFFRALYHAPVKRVCIENPVMHGYARDYLLAWDVPAFSFSAQPWMFGEPEIKRSCYWTRNLPALVPSNIVEGRAARVHRESPGPNRWKNRSRTLPGVAAAMANQWGRL